MPSLSSPAMAAGVLGSTGQPVLPAAGGRSLRPWHPDDAPAVHAAYQDAGIQRWHVRRSDSVAEAGEWIERWRGCWAAETGGHWAVVDAVTDALLGRVALKAFALPDATAEVAYWTAPAARGTGVCSGAVLALAAWALGDGGFHRLELAHSAANAASCRVALRTGFAQEGVRRKAALHADGWHDMHLHARVRGD
ncbi:putative acetyltransferase [Actinacidiphila reveromycinica]|uniref:Putative acetyltransferase n=1 Tax=Actinacidiphila reveromycinica TaxID=659352 RepID=A0A7U3UZ40_9ACTN|nr:GNAT family N-acetyltransferase [Streptomyces sp. SN-593]BBB01502.1 putative acetyltransferase [Streptomyces sp. SN-593]